VFLSPRRPSDKGSAAVGRDAPPSVRGGRRRAPRFAARVLRGRDGATARGSTSAAAAHPRGGAAAALAQAQGGPRVSVASAAAAASAAPLYAGHDPRPAVAVRQPRIVFPINHVAAQAHLRKRARGQR